MDEYCVFNQPGELRIERLLPGPIERVWTYLTESEKRGKWFCSGDMELKVGGKVEMHFNHANLSDEKEFPEKYKQYQDGITFTGKITKCDPPRLLAYIWDGEPEGGSEVTFELSPKGDEVLLVLTHRNMVGRREIVGTASGWHAHLDIMLDVLKEKEPRGFWSAHSRLEAEYEKRVPA